LEAKKAAAFFQKVMVQTQFGILPAQTLELCALIGIEHAIPGMAARARRTQRPSNCSPTPISGDPIF
jgi:hypothetical protein